MSESLPCPRKISILKEKIIEVSQCLSECADLRSQLNERTASEKKCKKYLTSLSRQYVKLLAKFQQQEAETIAKDRKLANCEKNAAELRLQLEQQRQLNDIYFIERQEYGREKVDVLQRKLDRLGQYVMQEKARVKGQGTPPWFFSAFRDDMRRWGRKNKISQDESLSSVASPAWSIAASSESGFHSMVSSPAPSELDGLDDQKLKLNIPKLEELSSANESLAANPLRISIPSTKIQPESLAAAEITQSGTFLAVPQSAQVIEQTIDNLNLSSGKNEEIVAIYDDCFESIFEILPAASRGSAGKSSSPAQNAKETQPVNGSSRSSKVNPMFSPSNSKKVIGSSDNFASPRNKSTKRLDEPKLSDFKLNSAANIVIKSENEIFSLPQLSPDKCATSSTRLKNPCFKSPEKEATESHAPSSTSYDSNNDFEGGRITRARQKILEELGSPPLVDARQYVGYKEPVKKSKKKKCLEIVPTPLSSPNPISDVETDLRLSSSESDTSSLGQVTPVKSTAVVSAKQESSSIAAGSVNAREEKNISDSSDKKCNEAVIDRVVQTIDDRNVFNYKGLQTQLRNLSESSSDFNFTSPCKKINVAAKRGIQGIKDVLATIEKVDDNLNNQVSDTCGTSEMHCEIQISSERLMEIPLAQKTTDDSKEVSAKTPTDTFELDSHHFVNDECVIINEDESAEDLSCKGTRESPSVSKSAEMRSDNSLCHGEVNPCASDNVSSVEFPHSARMQNFVFNHDMQNSQSRNESVLDASNAFAALFTGERTSPEAPKWVNSCSSAESTHKVCENHSTNMENSSTLFHTDNFDRTYDINFGDSISDVHDLGRPGTPEKGRDAVKSVSSITMKSDSSVPETLPADNCLVLCQNVNKKKPIAPTVACKAAVVEVITLAEDNNRLTNETKTEDGCNSKVARDNVKLADLENDVDWAENDVDEISDDMFEKIFSSYHLANVKCISPIKSISKLKKLKRDKRLSDGANSDSYKLGGHETEVEQRLVVSGVARRLDLDKGSVVLQQTVSGICVEKCELVAGRDRQRTAGMELKHSPQPIQEVEKVKGEKFHFVGPPQGLDDSKQIFSAPNILPSKDESCIEAKSEPGSNIIPEKNMSKKFADSQACASNVSLKCEDKKAEKRRKNKQKTAPKRKKPRKFSFEEVYGLLQHIKKSKKVKKRPVAAKWTVEVIAESTEENNGRMLAEIQSVETFSAKSYEEVTAIDHEVTTETMETASNSAGQLRSDHFEIAHPFTTDLEICNDNIPEIHITEVSGLETSAGLCFTNSDEQHIASRAENNTAAEFSAENSEEFYTNRQSIRDAEEGIHAQEFPGQVRNRVDISSGFTSAVEQPFVTNVDGIPAVEFIAERRLTNAEERIPNHDFSGEEKIPMENFSGADELAVATWDNCSGSLMTEMQNTNEDSPQSPSLPDTSDYKEPIICPWSPSLQSDPHTVLHCEAAFHEQQSGRREIRVYCGKAQPSSLQSCEMQAPYTRAIRDNSAREVGDNSYGSFAENTNDAAIQYFGGIAENQTDYSQVMQSKASLISSPSTQPVYRLFRQPDHNITRYSLYGEEVIAEDSLGESDCEADVSQEIKHSENDQFKWEHSGTNEAQDNVTCYAPQGSMARQKFHVTVWPGPQSERALGDLRAFPQVVEGGRIAHVPDEEIYILPQTNMSQGAFKNVEHSVAGEAGSCHVPQAENHTEKDEEVLSVVVNGATIIVEDMSDSNHSTGSAPSKISSDGLFADEMMAECGDSDSNNSEVSFTEFLSHLDSEGDLIGASIEDNSMLSLKQTMLTSAQLLDLSTNELTHVSAELSLISHQKSQKAYSLIEFLKLGEHSKTLVGKKGSASVEECRDLNGEADVSSQSEGCTTAGLQNGVDSRLTPRIDLHIDEPSQINENVSTGQVDRCGIEKFPNNNVGDALPPQVNVERKLCAGKIENNCKREMPSTSIPQRVSKGLVRTCNLPVLNKFGILTKSKESPKIRCSPPSVIAQQAVNQGNTNKCPPPGNDTPSCADKQAGAVDIYEAVENVPEKRRVTYATAKVTQTDDDSDMETFQPSSSPNRTRRPPPRKLYSESDTESDSWSEYDWSGQDSKSVPRNMTQTVSARKSNQTRAKGRTARKISDSDDDYIPISCLRKSRRLSEQSNKINVRKCPGRISSAGDARQFFFEPTMCSANKSKSMAYSRRMSLSSVSDSDEYYSPTRSVSTVNKKNTYRLRADSKADVKTCKKKGRIFKSCKTLSELDTSSSDKAPKNGNSESHDDFSSSSDQKEMSSRIQIRGSTPDVNVAKGKKETANLRETASELARFSPEEAAPVTEKDRDCKCDNGLPLKPPSPNREKVSICDQPGKMSSCIEQINTDNACQIIASSSIAPSSAALLSRKGSEHKTESCLELPFKSSSGPAKVSTRDRPLSIDLVDCAKKINAGDICQDISAYLISPSIETTATSSESGRNTESCVELSMKPSDHEQLNTCIRVPTDTKICTGTEKAAHVNHPPTDDVAATLSNDNAFASPKKNVNRSESPVKRKTRSSTSSPSSETNVKVRKKTVRERLRKVSVKAKQAHFNQQFAAIFDDASQRNQAAQAKPVLQWGKRAELLTALFDNDPAPEASCSSDDSGVNCATPLHITSDSVQSRSWEAFEVSSAESGIQNKCVQQESSSDKQSRENGSPLRATTVVGETPGEGIISTVLDERLRIDGNIRRNNRKRDALPACQPPPKIMRLSSETESAFLPPQKTSWKDIGCVPLERISDTVVNDAWKQYKQISNLRVAKEKAKAERKSAELAAPSDVSNVSDEINNVLSDEKYVKETVTPNHHFAFYCRDREEESASADRKDKTSRLKSDDVTCVSVKPSPIHRKASVKCPPDAAGDVATSLSIRPRSCKRPLNEEEAITMSKMLMTKSSALNDSSTKSPMISPAPQCYNPKEALGLKVPPKMTQHNAFLDEIISTMEKPPVVVQPVPVAKETRKRKKTKNKKKNKLEELPPVKPEDIPEPVFKKAEVQLAWAALKDYLEGTYPTSEKASEAKKSCRTAFEKISNHDLVNVVVQVVLENVNEPLDSTHSPPAPLLTVTQQRLFALFHSSPRFDSLYKLMMRRIRNSIFPERFVLPDDSVVSAAQFYMAICHKFDDKLNMIRFCLDAMAEMPQRGCVVVLAVLRSWMEVLPNKCNADPYLPAATLVMSVLLATPSKRMSQAASLRSLKYLLSKHFEYSLEVDLKAWTRGAVAALREGSVGAAMALAEINRIKGSTWSNEAVLSPLLETLGLWQFGGLSSESTAGAILKLIGKLLKALPSQPESIAAIKTDAVQRLAQILLSGKVSQTGEECLAETLLAVGQPRTLIASSLEQWTPRNSVSETLALRIGKFMHPPVIKPRKVLAKLKAKLQSPVKFSL